MTAADARVERVRPGEAGLEWLEQVLRELRAGDALAPLTIVPANLVVGRAALRRLARDGGYANVRVTRLHDLAEVLARPLLAGRKPLTPVIELAAARRAAACVPELAAVAGHLALAQALASLFRELRRTEANTTGEASAQAGSMGRAALEAYAAFRALTASYVDPTALRQLATARLAAATEPPRELLESGPIVLFLPSRLDPPDARLLAAAARWIPLRAAFACLDDPTGLGDAEAAAGADLLAAALGLSVPAERTASETSSPAVTIVRTPDPAEEAREVVRQIVARLEDGTPLHRMAIVYRQPDVYASLLRDELSLAGLPWHSLSGIPLSETRPGQCLLALLRLPEARFEREVVLRLVGLCEGLEPIGRARRWGPATPSWERISRDANILRGARDWPTRLRTYAADYDRQRARWAALDEAVPAPEEAPVSNAIEVGSDGLGLASPDEVQASPLASSSGRARRMAEIVESLAEALRPPADGASWQDFVAWAESARSAFLGEPEDWPELDRATVAEVRATLASLEGASAIEDGASFATFLAALEEGLRTTSQPAGHLGRGIVIGPVQSLAGLSFDYVAIVGLNEGQFPPAPPVDPFFPAEDADPLRTRSHARQRDRQAFLAAIAGASRGLILSAPESTAGRAAYPSRWLLAVAAGLAGEPQLHASAFRALPPSAHEWLRVVPSAQQGVAGCRVAATLDDRRLAEAIACRRDGLLLANHALAQREELPLGRALKMAAARLSDELTPFDGNVADLSSAQVLAHLLSGERPASATAVAEWAKCPFRYFLGQVLHVRATEAPEDRWGIDPRERGVLIHAVLERFFAELAATGRAAGSRDYEARDFDLIREMAEAEFQRVLESGLAGHPLLWAGTQADILADLETFLREDERWRRDHGWQPVLFEQRFGYEGDPDSWPAVDVPLANGLLRFRGVIDRVDLDATGQCAYLFDYKTGKSDSYAGLDLDPVLAGRELQLALYSEATRRFAEGHPTATGAYWFVSSRGAFERKGLRTQPDQVQARLTEALGLIASGIREGAFPQTPGEENEFYNNYATCAYCAYDRVCPPGRDDLWRHKSQSPACQPLVQLTLTGGS